MDLVAFLQTSLFGAMKRLAVAAAILLAASTPSHGDADTWLNFYADSTLSSPVSGKVSSDVEIIDAYYNFTKRDDRNLIPFGIIIDEHLNRPCSIDVYNRNINYGGKVRVSFERCSFAVNPVAMIRDLPKNALEKITIKEKAVLPSDHFVTAVQVCKAKRNNRIKGVRVYGHIGREGQIRGGAKRAEYKLPNCNRWKKVSRCPEGQAASGVKVHYKEEGKNDSIIGIQLLCRPLIQITQE